MVLNDVLFSLPLPMLIGYVSSDFFFFENKTEQRLLHSRGFFKLMILCDHCMIVKQHRLVHKILLHVATNKGSPEGTLQCFWLDTKFLLGKISLSTHILLETNVNRNRVAGIHL